MKIFIDNPVLSTWIFITIFFVTLFLFRNSKKSGDFSLSNSVSTELKGFAILSIVFAHIGYFLIEGDTFLFPLSIFAGVGVNLFLFLSGYGLTISSSSKKESIWQFYSRRLSKLYIPFWIVLSVLVLMDYFILKISYSGTYLMQSFSGMFLSADLFSDVNSNFWYMTLILTYYLLFPLVYIRKYPWITAVILYVVTYKMIYLNPVVFDHVDTLYKVHLFAFPLGVFFAWLFKTKNGQFIINTIKQLLNKNRTILKNFLSYLAVTILCGVIGYYGYYSGVGETIIREQTISLLVMFSFILLFILKKKQFNVLYLFGIYSYPIYLFHWPIISRYDFLFNQIPALLVLILYLFIFIGLGWLLQKLQEKYF